MNWLRLAALSTPWTAWLVPVWEVCSRVLAAGFRWAIKHPVAAALVAAGVVATGLAAHTAHLRSTLDEIGAAHAVEIAELTEAHAAELGRMEATVAATAHALSQCRANTGELKQTIAQSNADVQAWHADAEADRADMERRLHNALRAQRNRPPVVVGPGTCEERVAEIRARVEARR